MNPRTVARVIAALAAAFFVAFGLWAFFGPQSFFDNVATWEPFNEHFIHDIGAFQVGLGAVLALALIGWTALQATLGGVAIGAVLHAVAHIIDRDLGGEDSDPYVISFVAIVIVVGAVLSHLDRPASRH